MSAFSDVLSETQSWDVHVTNRSENLNMEGRVITSRISGNDKKMLRCFVIMWREKVERKSYSPVEVKSLQSKHEKRPSWLKI